MFEKYKIGAAEFFIFLAGISLYLTFFFLTTMASFSIDMVGHYDYITYIENNHKLPHPFSCNECYQPPLYYIIAGIFQKLFGAIDNMMGARIISLLSYIVYIIYARRILIENINQKNNYLIALALIVLWPTGITKTTTIGNDVPAIAANMAGFYYAIKWFKTGSQKNLIKTLIIGAMAVNIKTNGVIIFAVIAAFALIRKSFYELLRKRVLVVLALSIFVAIIPTARLAYINHTESRNESILVSNTDELRKEIIIDNKPYNYFGFSLKDYFTEPFKDAYEAKNGGNYFWILLIKTAIIVQYKMETPYAAYLLLSLGLLMPLFLCISSSYLAFKSKTFRKEIIPFWVIIILNIAAIITLRLQMPFSCSGDYRYIFPITTIFCVLYFIVMEHQLVRGNKIAATFGKVLAVLLLAVNLLFVLNFIYFGVSLS